MRRTAIHHLAESSRPRPGSIHFVPSSSSLPGLCTSPACRRVIAKSTFTRESYSTGPTRSPKHDGGQAEEVSLSKNARNLHASARAAAQPLQAHEPEDWYYPPEEAFQPYRGVKMVSASLHDRWIDEFTPPPIEDFEPDATISYEEDLPPAPVDEYDPTTPIKKARRRRVAKDAPPLPPLPIGELPPDGLSRFDWRETSLSSKPPIESRGRLWYPELARVRRREAEKKVLVEGGVYHDEIERYSKHFTPLLVAEHEEAERQLMQRLEDWPIARLVKEGYMLEGLGATIVHGAKRVEGILVMFNKTGKQDNTPLPFHKFDGGAYVYLSRTDPTVDPVLLDGSVRRAGERPGNDDDRIIDPASWLKAKVYSRGKQFVKLILPCDVEDLTTGHWRLDLGVSDWALQMQIQAIKALHNNPIEQDMDDIRNRPITRARPQLSDSEDAAIDSVLSQMDQSKHQEHQTILNGTSVRDILLRAFQTDYLPPSSSADEAHIMVPEPTAMKPTDVDATPLPTPHAQAAPRGVLARDQLIQSWTRRYRSPRVLKIEGDPHIPLNQSQLRAIAMMLSERVSLVQGPPGTGKTRVIVETIKLLKSHWKIPHPILVCAHTNVAVDNLLAGLRQHGIRALRSGSYDSVREDLQEYTFDHMVEKHPLFSEVDAMRTEQHNLRFSIREGGRDKNYSELKARVAELSSRIYGLETLMNREVLLSADVICTTCLSAASRKLRGIDFPIVFLDEASMATEPLSIVPLMKGSSHVAIIGDHKQLPPVIISPEAHAGGLSTSLFERLIHEKHIPSIMLDTQYRMHPSISAFPNQAFYASALDDGTAMPDGTPLSGLEPPLTAFLIPGKNVTFLDHDHPESPESFSLANHGDARIVCNVVGDLLYNNPELKGKDIGIIAPYTAQVRLLKERLLHDEVLKGAFQDLLGEERARELEEIEVKTVDGFEGREKDVMICSMVRSNPGGWVGFLGDWRRLNVALTRARKALLIVGSSRTLGKAQMGRHASETLPQGGDHVLRSHIKHLRRGGLIMAAD